MSRQFGWLSLVLGLVFGAITAWLAPRRGYSPVLGGIVGFFLGPIGLLVVWPFVPDIRPGQTPKLPSYRWMAALAVIVAGIYLAIAWTFGLWGTSVVSVAE